MCGQEVILDVAIVSSKYRVMLIKPNLRDFRIQNGEYIIEKRE